LPNDLASFYEKPRVYIKEKNINKERDVLISNKKCFTYEY